MQSSKITTLFLQGTALVLLFGATWFALSRIDWVAVFNIEETSQQTEARLGDLFWEVFSSSGKENKNPFVVASVDSMVNVLCLANKIDTNYVKVHVLNTPEVNAFALPNGHLVVYSGLITSSRNQEELCGVLGHELGHIKMKHVMKKLVKEVGLSVLISMTAGKNGGGEIIKQTAKMLSSTAFDRQLEKEADIQSVEYMHKAGIDPKPFADFLSRLASGPEELSKYTEWVSTHPDSKERADYILDYCKDKTGPFTSVLETPTWEKLQEKLEE